MNEILKKGFKTEEKHKLMLGSPTESQYGRNGLYLVELVCSRYEENQLRFVRNCRKASSLPSNPKFLPVVYGASISPLNEYFSFILKFAPENFKQRLKMCVAYPKQLFGNDHFSSLPQPYNYKQRVCC